jgi:DbpA RNA binding domain
MQARMDTHNSDRQLSPQNSLKNRLKDQVKKVAFGQNLDSQRRLVKSIAAELKISVLDCAAAMTVLCDADPIGNKPQYHNISASKTDVQPKSTGYVHKYKYARYRLDIGSQNQVNETELRKMLVEESGVDINNITNVRIQDTYTLIDLPDAMPQEIFQHLKNVEMNGRKLDIKRVKVRSKKHNPRRPSPHQPEPATQPNQND